MSRNDRPTRGPALDTIELDRTRCPQCGSVHLKKYRSLRDRGDGKSMAWVMCQRPSCAHRFRLVQG